MGWAIWITGLPGSGKSTIAKELIKELEGVKLLSLDEIRKEIVSLPKFTKEEREYVYKVLAEKAAKLVSEGQNVILDATGNRLIWRDYARNLIPNFMEVYVKCPLEICIKRESSRPEGLVMADLYRKALERKKTGKQFRDLGEVPGVDVPYEENKAAEIVIKSDKVSADEAAKVIFDELKKKGWWKNV